MDQLKLELIREELSLGKVRYYSSTTSTNDVAEQWLYENASHLSLVVADEQTKGRGRYGRKWYTPPQSALAFSIILTEDLLPFHFLRYSGLGSLAACETLRAFTYSSVKIKWPNDILINQKKVGGILAEAHWIGESLKGIVLGIGINISISSLPQIDQLNFPATFLANHTNKSLDRLEILKKILLNIKEWNNKISSPSFIKAWEQNLAYQGQQVQIKISEKEEIEGRLVGLSNSGEIVIFFSDGNTEKFNASEIKLRPSKYNYS
jgi:BirA family biotin operon repressor/biotin-[acetyl-CoA-carboxylase] ligase